jgi:hypothetical protein
MLSKLPSAASACLSTTHLLDRTDCGTSQQSFQHYHCSTSITLQTRVGIRAHEHPKPQMTNSEVTDDLSGEWCLLRPGCCLASAQHGTPYTTSEGEAAATGLAAELTQPRRIKPLLHSIAGGLAQCQ